MKVLRAVFLASLVIGISACDSDDDDNTPLSGGPDPMGGNGDGMMGTTSLAELAALPAGGEPVDDGLDQANADIMNLFGDANGEPVAVSDDDTVTSIVSRTQQAR